MYNIIFVQGVVRGVCVSINTLNKYFLLSHVYTEMLTHVSTIYSYMNSFYTQ